MPKDRKRATRKFNLEEASFASGPIQGTEPQEIDEAKARDTLEEILLKAGHSKHFAETVAKLVTIWSRTGV